MTEEQSLSVNDNDVPISIPQTSSIYLFCKRCFDIVCSSIALIILVVPMIVISILIKLDSKGPVIFKQERLGKDGKPFYIYKFRSMKLDAEKDGPQWANKNDDRCTKLGSFLRKVRLDELPQFFNIFIGNMSLVGPRPERAYFYEEFGQYIPEFKERLQVKPGLTGLAQVNGGYDLLPEEKIVFDLRYIKDQSFKLDLYCIFKTVTLLFTHEGAR